MNEKAAEPIKQDSVGRGYSSSISSGGRVDGRSPAVKISLEAQTADQKEKAAISIQLSDPDAMIDKILELLAARFPIQALYRVLASQQDIVNRVVSSPSTREELSGATPNTYNRTVTSKVNSAMYDELVKLSGEESSPVNSITNENLKLWLKSALANLSAGELEEVTTSVSPMNSSRLAQVLFQRAQEVKRPTRATSQVPPNLLIQHDPTMEPVARDSVIHDAGVPGLNSTTKTQIDVRRVSQDSKHENEDTTSDPVESAGKWETIDESFLLADRETEHSNGAASMTSSSFSIPPSESDQRQIGLSLWNSTIVDRVMQLSINELEKLSNGVCVHPDLQDHMNDEKFTAWIENLYSIRRRFVSGREFLYLLQAPSNSAVIVSEGQGMKASPICREATSCVVANAHTSNTVVDKARSSMDPICTAPTSGENSDNSVCNVVQANTGRDMNSVPSGTRDSFSWTGYSDISGQQRTIICISGSNTSSNLSLSNHRIDPTSTWVTRLEKALEAERQQIENACHAAISQVLDNIKIPRSGVSAVEEKMASKFMRQHTAEAQRIVKSVKYAVYKTIRDLCDSLGFVSADFPELEYQPLLSNDDEQAIFHTDQERAVAKFLAEASFRMAIHGCAQCLLSIRSSRSCTLELDTVLSIPFNARENRLSGNMSEVIEARRREALSHSLNAAIEAYEWEVLNSKDLLTFVESFFIPQSTIVQVSTSHQAPRKERIHTVPSVQTGSYNTPSIPAQYSLSTPMYQTTGINNTRAPTVTIQGQSRTISKTPVAEYVSRGTKIVQSSSCTTSSGTVVQYNSPGGTIRPTSDGVVENRSSVIRVSDQVSPPIGAVSTASKLVPSQGSITMRRVVQSPTAINNHVSSTYKSPANSEKVMNFVSVGVSSPSAVAYGAKVQNPSPLAQLSVMNSQSFLSQLHKQQAANIK